MADRLPDRYGRGEHEAVWRELREASVLDAPAYAEALAVARATMLRVARNAGQLAERLAGLGWRALSGRLLTPPIASDQEIIAAIERVTTTPLPPGLKAFWETVGGIDFVWDYKQGAPPPLLGVDVPIEQSDPLSIAAPHQCRYLIDEWQDDADDGHDPDEPWALELAPDALHKANISGGVPYGIMLPFTGADPIFAREPHGLPFIDYLRLCFRFGGFPGLQRHGRRGAVRALVAKLTDGLLDF